ncbi:hypothetical protein C8E83_1952 [Frondihabitans australicus]|uniref:Uncharacterized protein n=1 Tax=Frondihabitans australicus TaxID=386892 RepID=A0A495IHN5_9MICO|nr:hypothetical protein C8E83_1952 [Frondihabitans australicus]
MIEAELLESASWFRADEGLWVLDRNRTFGGTVDRQPQGFAVTDGRARPLGTFATLSAAQDHLLSHTRPL